MGVPMRKTGVLRLSGILARCDFLWVDVENLLDWLAEIVKLRKLVLGVRILEDRVDDFFCCHGFIPWDLFSAWVV